MFREHVLHVVPEPSREASTMWNWFPANVQLSNSIACFKSRLKHFYFKLLILPLDRRASASVSYNRTLWCNISSFNITSYYITLHYITKMHPLNWINKHDLYSSMNAPIIPAKYLLTQVRRGVLTDAASARRRFYLHSVIGLLCWGH